VLRQRTFASGAPNGSRLETASQGPKSRQLTELPFNRQNPGEAVSRAVSQFAEQHVFDRASTESDKSSALVRHRIDDRIDAERVAAIYEAAIDHPFCGGDRVFDCRNAAIQLLLVAWPSESRPPAAPASIQFEEMASEQDWLRRTMLDAKPSG
jgi:hypothetical protein